MPTDSTCDINKYETICKAEFQAINVKLDRLDQAIRGNGNPGINARLDRLERSEGARTKFLWLAVGVVVTLGIAALWSEIFHSGAP